MSKKPPSLVEFNFSEDIPPNPSLNGTIEIKDPITGEENSNFIYDEEEAGDALVSRDLTEEPIEDEEPLIRIEQKEQINRTELFDEPDVPNAKPVKVKKPRKPMSESHKAKLAIAREKAMASRKIKAEERKKMKALDIEEKDLVVKQKFKRVQKLKDEVNDDTDDKFTKTTKTSGITRQDLEDAQLDAIMKYEAIRKKRKEEKKEKAMIEEGKNKMLNQINRATGGQQNYRYRDGSNRFDNCY